MKKTTTFVGYAMILTLAATFAACGTKEVQKTSTTVERPAVQETKTTTTTIRN